MAGTHRVAQVAPGEQVDHRGEVQDSGHSGRSFGVFCGVTSGFAGVVERAQRSMLP